MGAAGRFVGVVAISASAACASGPAPSATAAAPLVCTLTPDELAEARAGLLPGLLERAKSVSDLQDGVKLSFDSEPGLLADLARMMEQERACCRFLRFQLAAEPAGGAITLDVTGPPGTREVLRSL